MRYRICHRTSYRYERAGLRELQRGAAAAARLRRRQTLLDFDLVIQPPATVIAFRDYYGNAVHDFGVPYLHELLVIEATSDVVTHAGEDEAIGGPLDGEPDLVRRCSRRSETTRRSATSSPSSSARARTSCSPTTPRRSRARCSPTTPP